MHHSSWGLQPKTALANITLWGAVYDAYNKPVMVAMALNPKSKKGKVLDYSKITSAYVRTNIQNLIDTRDMLYILEEQKQIAIDNYVNLIRIKKHQKDLFPGNGQ